MSRSTALCLAALLCSTAALASPPTGGIQGLQALIADKLVGVSKEPLALPVPGQAKADTVTTLLASPLTADAAVRIAILNNPDLQVQLGQIGLGLTDWQSADNLAKRQAQKDITALSAQVFKAWVNAVAAAHSVRTLGDAKATAEATGELARRMVQAGNMSKLNQAQHQAHLSDAALAVARAGQVAFAAREHLTVLLGLWGTQTQFELPTTLPELPADALDLPDVEARAIAARYALTLATADWQLQRTPPTTPRELWDIQADAASVRALAVQVRSQARLAYFNYRSRLDVARHLQTEVLPLRKFINDELTLRYNGMLTSVFDVLADSQTQTETLEAAGLATRDFWLAHADLQAVLAGVAPNAKE